MRLATLTLIPITFLFFSCGEDAQSPKADTASMVDSIPHTTVNTPPPTDFHAGMQVDCKTFEWRDTVTHAVTGYGYDLYVGDKKVIHQTLMPAIGGIYTFMTETDARKMGELAASRFAATGNFPTVYLNDYDSLKIQLPPAVKRQVDSTIAAQKKMPNGK